MVAAVKSYNYNQYKNYQQSFAVPNKIHFSGYTNEMLREFREINHIPKYINAAYKGYSGPKKFDFPTRTDLDFNSYPEITEEVLKLKIEILDKVKSLKKKPLGMIRVIKLFLKSCSTGNCWDTKHMPEFPGRDIQGKTQYGRYKGKIVSANYISNNIYGQACAASGLSLPNAKLAARLYSEGLLELLVKKKLPSLELLKFRDPECDQIAIESGYLDFFKNSPWSVPNIDPSMPHPVMKGNY